MISNENSQRWEGQNLLLKEQTIDSQVTGQ